MVQVGCRSQLRAFCAATRGTSRRVGIKLFVGRSRVCHRYLLFLPVLGGGDGRLSRLSRALSLLACVYEKAEAEGDNLVPALGECLRGAMPLTWMMGKTCCLCCCASVAVYVALSISMDMHVSVCQ